jgi:NAD(P)-dependent dehydrogenase (short-subunit alcohol dehydrogenase family)
MKSTALIIGASGGLGSALCQRWLQDEQIDSVIAVSRNPLSEEKKNTPKAMHFIQCDYSEAAITDACKKIDTLTDCIAHICICNGILHDGEHWPEKRIEEVNARTLQDIFTINSVIPMLWLKSLVSIVKGNTDCIIAVFSARIGSIGDNRSGGWYSYRASKAALNMLLKTAAIEYARRAKNIKLIAFHPGTTDTALSKPFQRSVNSENLFSTEFVADHLVEIMKHQVTDGELSYIDWENKAIVW